MDVLYPISAAFMSGIIHPATRYALTVSNQPIAFSAIVGLVSLLCLTAYFLLSGQARELAWPSRSALIPFVTASLLETMGFLLFSAAVSLGQVVLIAPIEVSRPMRRSLASPVIGNPLSSSNRRIASAVSALAEPSTAIGP